MNILSKQDHVSAVIEGVKFRTRLIGPATRARVNLEISNTRAKLSESGRQIETLEKQMAVLLDASEKDSSGVPLAATDISKATPEMLEVADSLMRLRDDQAAISRSGMAPAYFRVGLLSIEGVTMDGRPLTGEMLCEYGPDALFEEIFNAVAQQFYLSGAEVKNSSSPTTSIKPGDGTATEPESGTANDASSQATTSSETAGDTSLKLANAA